MHQVTSRNISLLIKMPPPATWTEVGLETTACELNCITILLLTNDEELPESISIVRGIPSNVPQNWIVLGAGVPVTAHLDRERKRCSELLEDSSRDMLQSSTYNVSHRS